MFYNSIRVKQLKGEGSVRETYLDQDVSQNNRIRQLVCLIQTPNHCGNQKGEEHECLSIWKEKVEKYPVWAILPYLELAKRSSYHKHWRLYQVKNSANENPIDPVNQVRDADNV